MHFSVPASFLIHGAILLWAFMHILHTPELDAPRQESIEVAIVTPSDILRLKKGSESSKELEAKAQEARRRPKNPRRPKKTLLIQSPSRLRQLSPSHSQTPVRRRKS